MIFNSNLFAIQNHISEFILSKLSRERMEKRVLVESDGLRRSSVLSRRGGLCFLPVCQYIVLSLFLRSGCFRVFVCGLMVDLVFWYWGSSLREGFDPRCWQFRDCAVTSGDLRSDKLMWLWALPCSLLLSDGFLFWVSSFYFWWLDCLKEVSGSFGWFLIVLFLILFDLMVCRLGGFLHVSNFLPIACPCSDLCALFMYVFHFSCFVFDLFLLCFALFIWFFFVCDVLGFSLLFFFDCFSGNGGGNGGDGDENDTRDHCKVCGRCHFWVIQR